MKKELSILIGCAALWCLGIVLAPLLPVSVISDTLYRFYSVVCHQFASHSFRIDNAPFGVCIRCTSIYGAFLGALIVLRCSSGLRAQEFSPVIIVLVSGVPIALDGLFSFTHFYDPSTLSRMFTGGVFGAGMAFLLQRTLSEIIHSTIQKSTARYETKT